MMDKIPRRLSYPFVAAAVWIALIWFAGFDFDPASWEGLERFGFGVILIYLVGAGYALGRLHK